MDVVTGVLTVEFAEIIYDGSSDERWDSYGAGTDHFSALCVPPNKATGNQKSICNEFNNVNYAYDKNQYGIYADHPNLTNTYFRMPNESVTTLQEFREWIAEHPIHLVYELATPQEIQLTPQQITALLGQNTIWSDADGQMTAVYLKKK